MFVLSAYRKYLSGCLPYQPGERLGEGAEGEVLSIVGDDTRVLKLTMMLANPGHSDNDYRYQKMRDGLDYFVGQHPAGYVRVYEHGHLGSCPLVGPPAMQYIFHYTVMEKLGNISDDEFEVFRGILEDDYDGLSPKIVEAKVAEMRSAGLDFEPKGVTLFADNIRAASVIHEDLHPHNIMKDIHGDFKLIDLDNVLPMER
jgi:serine/threonine protein kinase